MIARFDGASAGSGFSTMSDTTYTPSPVRNRRSRRTCAPRPRNLFDGDDAAVLRVDARHLGEYAVVLAHTGSSARITPNGSRPISVHRSGSRAQALHFGLAGIREGVVDDVADVGEKTSSVPVICCSSS